MTDFLNDADAVAKVTEYAADEQKRYLRCFCCFSIQVHEIMENENENPSVEIDTGLLLNPEIILVVSVAVATKYLAEFTVIVIIWKTM